MGFALASPEEEAAAAAAAAAAPRPSPVPARGVTRTSSELSEEGNVGDRLERVRGFNVGPGAARGLIQRSFTMSGLHSFQKNTFALRDQPER